MEMYDTLINKRGGIAYKVKKKNYYNLLTIFLIVVLLISLFYNYQYRKYKEQTTGSNTIFMNDFYYEIDETVNAIDRLVEGDFQDLSLTIIELTNHLTILEYMLSRVPYYISDRGAVPTDIKYVNHIINYGRNYEEHNILPFIEDSEIDEQERAFLEEVREFLVIIRDLLKSEKKVDINSDIQLEKFQDIISETMYGANKYRSFLEEYIESFEEN